MNKNILLKLKNIKYKLKNPLSSILCCKSYIFDKQFNTTETTNKIDELKTKIDEHGIHYQLFPFHSKFKTKKWKEIKNIYVRQYNPIAEYGGWGIRYTLSKKGIAVNIKGNIGIQLELVNGEKLLIGTQKKDDVELVLHTYENKIKIL